MYISTILFLDIGPKLTNEKNVAPVCVQKNRLVIYKHL